MATDWRVIVDDTGGIQSGWPSVVSDEEDRAVIHTDGFFQEYWQGPTKKEAMEIAQLVADFMNKKGRETPTNSDLLPCPFCGSHPSISRRMDEDLATHNIVEWVSVYCTECDVGFSIPDGYDCGTAIERWNRRV